MESEKGSSEEMHPLFPSGDWEGFYKYPYDFIPPGQMNCFLNFHKGTVSGGGSDEVGTFSWRGAYDTKALTCQMTKHYSSHTVDYQGYVDENGIWGNWRIDNFNRGGFHIWPKKGGEEEEASEIQSEEVEVESTVLEEVEMKLFKNVSLAAMKPFLAHFSFFYRHVAMLCSSKKALIEPKTFSLSAQQTFLNNFDDKIGSLTIFVFWSHPFS